MEKATNFKDFKVWQRGHQFVLAVIRLTSAFPKSVQYGIGNQLIRASLSITNNIAEGTGRNSTKELRQFAFISRGSLEECRNILLVCRDLDYINKQEYKNHEDSATHVSRLLNGLIRSLNRKLRI